MHCINHTAMDVISNAHVILKNFAGVDVDDAVPYQE
jgi:hypothetical protein